MSLTCDVTGSTDRVSYLPSYMQSETVKKVCFRVAVKMEQERLAGLTAPVVAESATTETPSILVEKEEVAAAGEEVVEQKPVKKGKKKGA